MVVLRCFSKSSLLLFFFLLVHCCSFLFLLAHPVTCSLFFLFSVSAGSLLEAQHLWSKIHRIVRFDRNKLKSSREL